MKVLKESVTAEIERKHSRFITYLFPITSMQEVREKRQQVARMHPKATHICSAYIVAQRYGSNDDGEPASSAGLPMLRVLTGAQLDQVLALVVRYFGKTLLGYGGLVSAYQDAVKAALKQATLLQQVTKVRVHVSCPYQDQSLIERMLPTEGMIETRSFQETVHYTLLLSDPSIRAKWNEQSSGRIHILDETPVIIAEEITHEHQR